MNHFLTLLTLCHQLHKKVDCLSKFTHLFFYRFPQHWLDPSKPIKKQVKSEFTQEQYVAAKLFVLYVLYRISYYLSLDIFA